MVQLPETVKPRDSVGHRFGFHASHPEAGTRESHDPSGTGEFRDAQPRMWEQMSKGPCPEGHSIRKYQLEAEPPWRSCAKHGPNSA